MTANRKKFSGREKRKGKRHAVLETFSLFVVIPGKGDALLSIKDISQNGLSFFLSSGGEDLTLGGFQVEASEEFKISLYLNRSLFLPLSAKVKRVENTKQGICVGVEFLTVQGPAMEAYSAFFSMLELLAEGSSIQASS